MLICREPDAPHIITFLFNDLHSSGSVIISSLSNVFPNKIPGVFSSLPIFNILISSAIVKFAVPCVPFFCLKLMPSFSAFILFLVNNTLNTKKTKIRATMKQIRHIILLVQTTDIQSNKL